jgi:hypothetical protein
MNKQKVGLVVFWLGAIWAFAWGIIGSIIQGKMFLGVMTFEELSQTIWKFNGPLANTWGFSVPLGVLLAGIGVLLYTGAKSATVWKFGLGITVIFFTGAFIGMTGHHSWLYATMATVILLSFFWILWSWAKERPALSGNAAVGADLKLAGYVFLVIGMWFTCGVVGWFYYKAFAGRPYPTDPINVMILYALGLTFICLGQWKTVQK